MPKSFLAGLAASLALLPTASLVSQSAPTAESATKAAIARIHEVDPKVHAVIAIDPTALDQARAIDQQKKARGLLYGYAILIKDNIESDGPAPHHRRQPRSARQRTASRRAHRHQAPRL